MDLIARESAPVFVFYTFLSCMPYICEAGPFPRAANLAPERQTHLENGTFANTIKIFRKMDFCSLQTKNISGKLTCFAFAVKSFWDSQAFLQSNPKPPAWKTSKFGQLNGHKCLTCPKATVIHEQNCVIALGPWTLDDTNCQSTWQVWWENSKVWKFQVSRELR